MDPSWLIDAWTHTRALVHEPVGALCLLGFVLGGLVNLPEVWVVRFKAVGAWHAEAFRRLRPTIRSMDSRMPDREDRARAKGALLREHGVNPLLRPTSVAVSLGFAALRGVAIALAWAWTWVVLARLHDLAWADPALDFTASVPQQQAWWVLAFVGVWIAVASRLRIQARDVNTALVWGCLELGLACVAPLGLVGFVIAWGISRQLVAFTGRDLRDPELPELPGPVPEQPLAG
jgi:hypothetical protein